MQNDLMKTIEDLVSPILEEFAAELVDLELKNEGRDRFLRLFIDKPNGVTLDDCIAVSREVEGVLEIEDPIKGAYRLEVSSPGLDRPLKKRADYERFVGQAVKVKTQTLMDPDGRGHERKTFNGQLVGLEGDMVCILQTDKKGGEIKLSLEDIAKANLEPEF
jgi:ribosome maturation factor RimP